MNDQSHLGVQDFARRPALGEGDRPVGVETARGSAATEAQLFDNSGIVEAYPGIVTPLSCSFARLAYAREFETFARLAGVGRARLRETRKHRVDLLARIDGRLYYNVGAWYRMLAGVPGFTRDRAAADRIIGLSEPIEPELAARLWPRPAGGLAALADRLRAMRVGLRLAWNTLILRRTVLGFRRRVDALLALDERSIAALSARDLALEFARLERQLIGRWDAPLVNDFVCAAAFAATRSLFGKWFGAEGLALHGDFLLGQGDYVTVELPRRIRAMADLAAADPDALEALRRADLGALRGNSALHQQILRTLSRYGDYCGHTLKFETPPLLHDPRKLFEAVLAAVGRPARPAAATDDPMRRLAALASGRRFRHLVARRLLRFAGARLRDRESLRFERSLVFGFARHVLFAIGQRLWERGALDEARDVLFLQVEEALAVAGGRFPEFEMRGLVAARKQEASREHQAPEPPRRILRGMQSAPVSQAQSPPQGKERWRRGLGCAPGVASGPVAIVGDPAWHAPAGGAILVARCCDPGWIALYPGVAAVLAESGDRLSSAGIVARAMGIPCIVGLKRVTEWLADGDPVEVDGASGRVTKLEG